jgi:hypothetical protein
MMNNLKVLRSLIVVLDVATALVHFWLFYGGLMHSGGLSVIQVLFLLNGLGYLTLLGAFFLTLASREQVRNLVHYLLMVFAASTIIAWVIITRGRFLITLSIFDKVTEILLILTVWLHLRLMQKRGASATS